MILDLLIASRVFEISSGADLDDTAKIITANVDAKMGSCRKTWTALNADASQIAVKILNTSQSCKEFQAAIDADKSHLQVTALSTVQELSYRWYSNVLYYKYPGENATNAAQVEVALEIASDQTVPDKLDL